MKPSQRGRRVRIALFAVLLIATIVPASAAAGPAAPASYDAWQEQLLDEAGFHFTEIGMGDFHTCAVRVDSSLYCWGNDQYGQTDHPNGSFLDVAGGLRHTCGVRTNGTAVCWGNNDLGQGSGVPAGPFTRIEAGGDRSCALTAEGGIACWGSGTAGTPTGTFTDLAVGDMTSCAVRDNGELQCWGPLVGGASPPSGVFTDVSVGVVAACATRVSGDLACWGNNNFGQLSSPTGTFVRVALGYGAACAVTSGGSTTCWGSYIDAPMVPVTNFEQLDIGRTVACGLDPDGAAACFGIDFGNGIVAAPRTSFSPEVTGYVRSLQTGHDALESAPTCSFTNPRPSGSRAHVGRSRMMYGWVDDDTAVGVVELSIFDQATGVYLDAASQPTAIETWVAAAIRLEPGNASGQWRHRLVLPPTGSYMITCRVTDADGNAGLRPVRARLTVG